MIQTLQLQFEDNNWKTINKTHLFDAQKAQLVFVFGEKQLLASEGLYQELKQQFTTAQIVFASTAGEILQQNVSDNSIAVTAMQFEHTRVEAQSVNIEAYLNDSFVVGKTLSESLQKDDLAGIFVFSDGMKVNGSELVLGLNENNVKLVPITGGLAGDGANFKSTLTGLNKQPAEGEVIAIGLYSTKLKIGHGSIGGWDEFGHERTITKSNKNVLLELDGINALSIYKEYLGPYVDELPASALLFPLSLKIPENNKTVVRTILSINEENQSMTFAGNMPEGSKVRLMKANFDKIIDASNHAAKDAETISTQSNPEVALLVSCVGRKLILQERTEEEVESAIEILGKKCATIGFYSYGEISPLNTNASCELHNQTMTITTLSEQ